MITYVIDTSAVNRILTQPAIQKSWHETLTAGVVGLCDPIELEVLFSARSLADRLRKKELLADLFTWVVTPDNVWVRAHQVQQLLTEQGQHRSAGVVDLITAATAETNDLILLHYDHDYDTIAKITGQPTTWVAPPGSVP